MIENQLHKKISIVCYDNGTDYFDVFLRRFPLKEKGIQHQSTCHDSPRQNGISKKKKTLT